MPTAWLHKNAALPGLAGKPAAKVEWHIKTKAMLTARHPSKDGNLAECDSLIKLVSKIVSPPQRV